MLLGCCRGCCCQGCCQLLPELLVGMLLVRADGTFSAAASDYFCMWEELSGKPGKKLQEMIGAEHLLLLLLLGAAATRPY